MWKCGFNNFAKQFPNMKIFFLRFHKDSINMLVKTSEGN